MSIETGHIVAGELTHHSAALLQMENILQEQSVTSAGSNSYLKRKTRSSKGTC